MNEFHGKTEVSEAKPLKEAEFRNIKPETEMTPQDAKSYWDKQFSDSKTESIGKTDVSKEKLEQTLNDYFQDLKSRSEMPDTIPERPFEASDLKKVPPEENAIMREEFNENRSMLISQWEANNNCSWPTYKEDVYITRKDGESVKIKEPGMRYDAHHIQPLGLGGKNEASNLTPLSADIHYDHRGVHALGSPYDKIDKVLGGVK